jgi:putative ABC transport system ATP-binding protein
MRVELHGVEKSYQISESVRVPALRGVSLCVESGELVSLVGASGCGKSTLLSVIGLLAWTTGGRYLLDGQDVSLFSRAELAAMRSKSVGFIFQSYNLMPRECAWRNVMLPMVFQTDTRSTRKARAMEALEAVGLGHRAEHFPSQLSGGEQQRIAIARALVNHPKLLLADEPTGNLDSKTGKEVLRLILELGQQYGSSVIMATHDSSVVGQTGRRIEMSDGQIISNTPTG